jgi:deoxyribodipyrimidine photo-lyase
VRRWLPELADVPDEHVHEPWKATGLRRRHPEPIVSHEQARRHALARLRALSRGKRA